MAFSGLLTRRKPTAHQHTSTPEHLVAEAEATALLGDAEVNRALALQAGQLDLVEKQQLQKEAAEDRAEAREQAKRKAKRAEAAAKRDEKRAERRKNRAEFKARFRAALAGRLVLLLVACAVGTAWYGQFGYLKAAFSVVFAFTAATALELLGLAMGAIVREATGGPYRDRAIWARLVMWGVIAFSAWSNLSHNGVVMAALSVLGPTAWEVQERWQRRKALHEAGLLAPRPVRPRFPLDQMLLFPLWTLAAYRVAVRDRIESTELALKVARIERGQRKLFSRVNRRKWTRLVRLSIESNNRALIERLEAELAIARSNNAEVEGLLAAGAMLLGPDRVRETAESIESPVSVESGSAKSVDRSSVESIEADHRSVESTDDQVKSSGLRLFDRVTDRSTTRGARQSTEPTRSIERATWQSSTVDREGSVDRVDQAGAIESPVSVELGSAKSVDRRSVESTDVDRPVSESTESTVAESIEGTGVELVESTETNDLIDRPKGARRKTDVELQAEIVEWIKANGWTLDTVPLDPMRTELQCGWKRAEKIVNRLKAANANDSTAGVAADQVAA